MCTARLLAGAWGWCAAQSASNAPRWRFGLVCSTKRQQCSSLALRVGVQSGPPQLQSRRARCDAAVDTIRCQVRRLIIHPKPPPFALHLAKVFGLDQQHVHAVVSVAGVLIDEATRVAQGNTGGHRQKQHCAICSCPASPRCWQLPLAPASPLRKIWEESFEFIGKADFNLETNFDDYAGKKRTARGTRSVG